MTRRYGAFQSGGSNPIDPAPGGGRYNSDTRSVVRKRHAVLLLALNGQRPHPLSHIDRRRNMERSNETILDVAHNAHLACVVQNRRDVKHDSHRRKPERRITPLTCERVTR